MKKFTLGIIVCLLSFFSFGQTKPLDLVKYLSKYPEDKAVILENSASYLLTTKGGKLEITKHVTQKTLVLDENATWLGEESIHFTDFEKIENISAKTLIPLKNKYKAYDVNDIETKDVLVRGIFFADNKQKTFSYPNFQKGAILTLEYDEIILDPHLLGGFGFSNYFPVEKSKVTVSFPDDVKLSHAQFGKFDNIKLIKNNKSGTNTWTWSAVNIAKEKYEEDAPNASYFSPYLAILINEYTINGQKQTILKGVDDLFAWYKSLIKGLNDKADNSEMKVIVDNITKDAKTDIEKVKAVYQWVQGNIKYIAFEDGLGGFRPREADDICSKKYGDCKDMANIIVEMLEIAGVKGNLTWIGTRNRPYKYAEMPTPVVDNHMIASAIIDGKRIFLDGTGSYTPFGFPTSMIQGKEALIDMGDGKYEVEEVPIISSDKNKTDETIQLSISGNTLLGKAKRELTGYEKTSFAYASYSANSNERDEFYNKVLNTGNNKFEIDTANENFTFDMNQNTVVNYEFHLNDYIKKVGEKIYINLNLSKDFRKNKIELEKRTKPFEVDYKYVTKRTIELTIPQGYTLDYLPQNKEFNNDLFGFKLDYKNKNGKITLVQTFTIDHLILEKEQFKNWNSFVDTLNEAYREVLSIKKSN